MDLADLKKLRGYNDMYRYLLVIIDVYSRFAWAKPMKSKSANNTYPKFVSVLQKESMIKMMLSPKLIQTNMGTKFQKIRE